MDKIFNGAGDDVGAERETKCPECAAAMGYGEICLHCHIRFLLLLLFVVLRARALADLGFGRG